jgi:hypothetical protein
LIAANVQLVVSGFAAARRNNIAATLSANVHDGLLINACDKIDNSNRFRLSAGRRSKMI